MITDETFDLDDLEKKGGCPICNSTKLSLIGSKKTIHPKPSNQLFDILRCKSCNHWFTSPIPSQEFLLKAYANGSFSVLGEKSSSAVSREVSLLNKIGINKKDLRKYNWIIDRLPSSSGMNYLELGIGSGLLFRHFILKGHKCYGVEPGLWVEKDNSIFKSLNDIPLNLKFETIVANDVLEHVNNPSQILEKLVNMLNSDGQIFLAFPNCDSFRAKLNGANWRMVRPIGHLHYFSRKSIFHLAKIHRLQVTHISNHDLIRGGFIRCTFELFRHLLRFRLRSAIKSIFQLIIFLPVQSIGLGDQWRVVFRKP
jgi:SAM-dependent methyltransferase